MARKTGVVLGLGEFGLHLAKSLSADGCDVIAVDMDSNKIDNVKDYIAKAVVADIRSKMVLQTVMPMEADFVVVAVGQIEASLISTLYLKEISFKHIIVKAVNDEHERILRLIGIKDIVFPEKDMAARLSAKLVASNMLDYLPLTDDYSIAEVAPNFEMEGNTLAQLGFRKKYDLIIIAIKELVPARMVFMPQPDFIIKMSDVLVVLGSKESITKYNSKR